MLPLPVGRARARPHRRDAPFAYRNWSACALHDTLAWGSFCAAASLAIPPGATRLEIRVDGLHVPFCTLQQGGVPTLPTAGIVLATFR